MNNRRFYELLHAPRERNRPKWTLEKIAEAIYVNRQHLNDVINNKAGLGKQVRPKLVKFFKQHFEQTWPEILNALKWDANGEPVPRRTSDVRQLEGDEHG